MNKLKLLFKGFFMGIANVIPGVSSGTLAIVFGIYEDLLDAIGNFFGNFKKNIVFLLPICIGIGLAIIGGSVVIEKCLDSYALPTVLFFAGLIVGGIPMLYQKIKKEQKFSNWIFFLLTFVLVIGLNFFGGFGNVSFIKMNIMGYIMLALVGGIAAGTMIVPGISGSLVLMILGYYEPIIEIINEFIRFENLWDNFLILVPFGIGVLLGLVVFAKGVKYLINKYEVKSYFAILGFVISSLITIFILFDNFEFNLVHIILSVVTFSAGTLISLKFGD